MQEWLLSLLRCPVCKGPLIYRTFDRTDAQGLLGHDSLGCDELYPVINGIPRLLVGGARLGLVRSHRAWFNMSVETAALAETWSKTGARNALVAAFDDEWTHFRGVGTQDHSSVFKLYFDLVPWDHFRSDRLVIDAGCGAGRWAREVAMRGPRVVAVDLGNSIEIARANTPHNLVACVQADLLALLLAPRAADWAYSLGVLHHTNEPLKALSNVVEVVKPGGLLLLYLYYALDNRGAVFRGIFQAVDHARRLISRQPRPVARALAAIIATSVYWPLARLAAGLERLGATRLALHLPLSFYRHLSFETMRNDSLDRFGTALERRYTQKEMVQLMTRGGLTRVAISDKSPLWHGVGVRAESGGASEGDGGHEA